MNTIEVDELISGKEKKLDNLKFEMDSLSPWDDEWCDLAEKFIEIARERNKILDNVSDGSKKE